VTRHGPRATYPAALVLAETVSPVPTAARGAITTSRAELPALANSSRPSETGQSAFTLAPASAVSRANAAGPKPKNP